MKRFAIILIVLLLVSMACAAQAVTLQQGWYARFGYVQLVTEAQPDQTWLQDWLPASGFEQMGSIAVSDAMPSFQFGRTITITSGFNATSGVIFEDSGVDAAYAPFYELIYVNWETNYDANRMLLQAFRRSAGKQDELIWSQTNSGYSIGGGNILNSSALKNGESLVFKVAVVPEPLSAATLLIGFITTIPISRKRRS